MDQFLTGEVRLPTIEPYELEFLMNSDFFRLFLSQQLMADLGMRSKLTRVSS